MTELEPRCTIIPPGAGVVGQSTAPDLPRVEVKLGADAGAGYSVVDYLVPARFSPPPRLHRQTREDTTVYIVSGELHYWFLDGEAVAGAGTVVRIPRGAWSRWANDNDKPCRLLAIFSPAGFERYFLDLSRAMADPQRNRAELGEVIGQLRHQYGDQDHPD